MKILARNLSRSLTEEQLHELFAPFGEIAACDLVMDRETGKSKGFGFIEMPVEAEANQAIKKLNKKVIQGLAIRVKKTLG